MAHGDGRIVLITGAARGIGAASARRLAAAGARLVLADVDAGVEKIAAELGGVAVQADVTRPADIARMVEEPYKRWGRLDVLFNNAGVIRVQPMLEVTEAEWDRVMSVNLRAVFFVLQAVARRMKNQSPMSGSELRGKLIHTASIAGYRGGGQLTTPYSASKAGVISLTRSAAQVLAGDRALRRGAVGGTGAGRGRRAGDQDRAARGRAEPLHRADRARRLPPLRDQEPRQARAAPRSQTRRRPRDPRRAACPRRRGAR